MALDLVSPDTACLVHVYAAEYGRGTCAASEPLLMTLPVGRNVFGRCGGRKGERVKEIKSRPELIFTLDS